LATAEPDYKRISGLSFGTLTAEDKSISKGSYGTVDIVLSVILVILVIFVLSYFTG
jgi:SSS family solute:Na+ symporter